MLWSIVFSVIYRLFITLVIFFILVFFIVPIAFWSSNYVRITSIFTRFDLPDDPEYFQTRHFPSHRNEYVTVNGAKLGVWKVLPVELAYQEYKTNKSFDYDEVLLNSTHPVLMYFHGTGETRTHNLKKYELFTLYFYVISFDYRGYGDSGGTPSSEDLVVSDCVLLYKWLRNKTRADIYVWGTSLGSAISAKTVATLENKHGLIGKALILEAAFTNLEDILLIHPLTKVYNWLPWFNLTILYPLRSSGLVFQTDRHIATISCHMMILHSERDNVIPVRFGRKLYKIASERTTESLTVYYEYHRRLGINHNSIFRDPLTKLYVKRFLELVGKTNRKFSLFEISD